VPPRGKPLPLAPLFREEQDPPKRRGLRLRPNGATGCSHGWSGGAAQPADAQPVVSTTLHRTRPGGAEAPGRQHRPNTQSCRRPRPRAVGGLVRSDQPAAAGPAILELLALGATGHVFVAGAGAGLIRRSPQATPATSPAPATPITTGSSPPNRGPTLTPTPDQKGSGITGSESH